MKHRYEVSGLTSDGEEFISQCISTDIVEAIKMYREMKFSVHMIKKCEQVHADTELGICK